MTAGSVASRVRRGLRALPVGRVRRVLAIPPLGWLGRAGGRRPPGDGAARRPAPRVVLVTGPWLPGAAVRLLPAALVVAVGAAAGMGTIGWLALVTLALATVVRPALPAAAVVVLVAGLALLGGPDATAAPVPALPAPATGAVDAPGWPAGPLRLGVLVLALDLAVRTAALAAHTGWRSRVEWSVLARLGRSVARTQLVVQGALWLVVGLRAVAGGGGLPEAVRLAALVAVGALLVLAVPRVGRPGARD